MNNMHSRPSLSLLKKPDTYRDPEGMTYWQTHAYIISWKIFGANCLHFMGAYEWVQNHKFSGGRIKPLGKEQNSAKNIN